MNHRPAQRDRCPMAYLLIGALCLPGLAIAGTHPGKAYFAEPTSGRRVASYAIDLPLARDTRRTYLVPEQCAAIEKAVDEGLDHAGGVIDRRLWRKASEDCWFYGLLHQHPVRTPTDHVSAYDFMNARLSDLPIDVRCADDTGDEAQRCQPGIRDAHGVLRYFPLGEPLDTGMAAPRGECALRNGVFYGRLFVDAQGAYCEAHNGRSSLRLIAVDYADVNGDRVLDAVLRFVPIGPGAARTTLILPLTRKSSDARFTFAEQQAGGGED